jgi:glutamyl endopeptidase
MALVLKHAFPRAAMEMELDPRLVSGPAMRSAIGEDESRPVAEVTAAPWRFICLLECQLGWFKWIPYGTGWLAAPDKVVTAAHCLQYPDDHPQKGQRIPKIRVTPGRNGENCPFKWQDCTQFVSGWDGPASASKDPRLDFAVIHLREPWRNLEGHFELGTIDNPEELIGQRVNVSGYPGATRLQYFHEDVVVGVAGGMLQYRTDTEQGQSGSPVFLYHPSGPGRGQVKVVGLHTRGSNSRQPTQEQFNSGPLLAREAAERIARWIATGPGPKGMWA